MTQRQKEYIEFIESYSFHKFMGNPDSQEDISQFIKQYAPIAHDLYQSSDPWGCKY